MAEPFIGEIRQVGFNFVPPGWLACLGQVVSIAEYDTLFTLIGTTYGGDGVQTFGLPDLQGRCTVHQGQSGGSNYVPGQKSGSESITLTQAQMAVHSHPVQANSGMGTLSTVTTLSTWAQVSPDGTNAIAAYAAAPGNATLSASTVSVSGHSMPIDVRQPYVIVNFMIATVGVFPSQS